MFLSLCLEKYSNPAAPRPAPASSNRVRHEHEFNDLCIVPCPASLVYLVDPPGTAPCHRICISPLGRANRSRAVSDRSKATNFLVLCPCQKSWVHRNFLEASM
ncbi:hypothetical protein D5086_029156 [Populus alba]|uniref:Uncharacterized protein n=1 Tax=Populus alba TaxID=43335 RepID=A0ACC4ATB3_POPAL